jgi:hypothetical protein
MDETNLAARSPPGFFTRRLVGPGYDLPVYKAEGVLRLEPALIIVRAWRYASQIKNKNMEYVQRGGRFVVPLPDISILAK